MLAAVENLNPLMLALFGAILGAIGGSYVGAIVTRWPREQSTLAGRSCCDSCGNQLVWHDLVPLLSFLFLRGNCASCKAPIDRAQAIAEWMGALLCGAAFLIFPLPAAFAWTAFILILIPLALLDARHLWLPNRLTFLLALAGLLFGHHVAGEGQFASRIIAATTGLLSLTLLRWLFRKLRGKEGMGAGDPKLFGAIALWLSPQDLPLLILLAAMLGIILALANMRSNSRSTMLPFGTMLAVAGVVVGFSRATGGVSIF